MGNTQTKRPTGYIDNTHYRTDLTSEEIAEDKRKYEEEKAEKERDTMRPEFGGAKKRKSSKKSKRNKKSRRKTGKK